MFERETYYKIVAGLLILAFTVNHIVALHRASVLQAIIAKQPQAEIIAALGTPAQRIDCQANVPAIELLDQQHLCKSPAREVDVFPRCYINWMCPGGNYVSFDQAGQVLYQYGWVAPLFPGGPAL